MSNELEDLSWLDEDPQYDPRVQEAMWKTIKAIFENIYKTKEGVENEVS